MKETGNQLLGKKVSGSLRRTVFFYGASESSVLALEPIQDNGAWDLCQILTFLNGRNITLKSNDERLTANAFGSRACVDTEILHAANLMWNNRHNLVARKLVYSLLLFNSAFACRDINLQAGIITPAFNGVYDDWLRNTKKGIKSGNIESIENFSAMVDLTDDEKKSVKASVIQCIDSMENISKNKKDALNALLGGRINGGLLSPVNLIEAMLIAEKIIPKEPCEQIVNRIKFINAVRNKFAHSGHPPSFAKNKDMSVEFSIFIIGRLIPDIIQMYLGKIVGFSEKSFGSLCQFKHDISDYFMNGIYAGLKVEEESYSTMIDALLQEDSRFLI